MSLPNYILNLDEFAQAIRDAFDSPKLLNLGQQRVHGLQVEVDTSKTQTVSWVTPMDILLTGVKFGVNDYRNIGYEDTFDMLINDEVMFENVRIKEMYEYKRYRQPYALPENTEIKFVFNNNDDMKKYVWFDIEYVDKEIEAKTIMIVCIDITTGQEIERVQHFIRPPHTTTITAPTLDGYIAVGETTKTIKLETYSPNVTEIKFEYEPDIPPVDPDIDHDYDWKIVLRWENDCPTDLDLHGEFDNGDVVSYHNKEIGSDSDKAWLDYDYTSHNGDNDKEDKPEILTILGAISNNVTIKVDGFSRTEYLSEDVIVEIQKLSSGSLTTVKTYTIPYDMFAGDDIVTVCDIDLVSGKITERL